jgi:hypothetical protein
MRQHAHVLYPWTRTSSAGQRESARSLTGRGRTVVAAILLPIFAPLLAAGFLPLLLALFLSLLLAGRWLSLVLTMRL